MAPAGNKDAFFGAIHAGADAIYLGGNKFGARAYAENFTEEELVKCIRYAHLWGRRVYLTVNTLVKDKEWDQLYEYILPYYEAGLDGVIIQDMGVFLFVKENFPGMELHVSTQMTLTGSYGAAYMKEAGACRIVPARELSLKEIRKIKEDTGLQIEAFIHGAMCYSYSGQCLFSSVLGGRSGNRGKCAQPCRLPYRLCQGQKSSIECYPLSLKDMCTLENIPELIEAGIDSFKIEGRMKKAEYAAGVTAIYRKVIDRYLENPDGFYVSDNELKEISGLYIRSERQEGYYHRHNGSEMITLKNPAYSGTDEILTQRVKEKYIDTFPKKKLEISAYFRLNEPACIIASSGEMTLTVKGDTVTEAKNQPITAENIKKQLTKLGDTVFSCESIFIEADEHIFYPLKAINELRRKAVGLLEDCIIENYGLTVRRTAQGPVKETEEAVPVSKKKTDAERSLTVKLSEMHQLEAFVQWQQETETKVRRVYIDTDLFMESDAPLSYTEKIDDDTDVYLALPHILRDRDAEYLEKVYEILRKNCSLIKGCMVRSLEGYAWLNAKKYTGNITSDAGFYIWNRKTLSHWGKSLESFCLPWELNAGEQKDLIKDFYSCAAEKILYGHIPMMLSANCVMKTLQSCKKLKARGLVTIKDRMNKELPVVYNCMHCMNIIYNNIPLSCHNTANRWIGAAFLRLDFSVESKHLTREILDFYGKLINGESAVFPLKEFTTGHEKRGAE